MPPLRESTSAAAAVAGEGDFGCVCKPRAMAANGDADPGLYPTVASDNVGDPLIGRNIVVAVVAAAAADGMW